MEIVWHGDSLFHLKDKGISLEIKKNKIEMANGEKSFDWPGEYEVDGVHILAIKAWTKSKTKEEEEGGKGDSTLIFCININDVKVCHLGELGHSLSSDMVKEIGDVDILLIDGTKEGNLGAKKADEVLEDIDAKVVIPMGKGNFSDFLKETGAEAVTPVEKFVATPESLPMDKMEFVVLQKA